MSSDEKRQMLGDLEAKDEVNSALDVLRMWKEAQRGPTLCTRGFGATIVLLTNIQILYGVC